MVKMAEEEERQKAANEDRSPSPRTPQSPRIRDRKKRQSEQGTPRSRTASYGQDKASTALRMADELRRSHSSDRVAEEKEDEEHQHRHHHHHHQLSSVESEKPKDQSAEDGSSKEDIEDSTKSKRRSKKLGGSEEKEGAWTAAAAPDEEKRDHKNNERESEAELTAAAEASVAAAVAAVEEALSLSHLPPPSSPVSPASSSSASPVSPSSSPPSPVLPINSSDIHEQERVQCPVCAIFVLPRRFCPACGAKMSARFVAAASASPTRSLTPTASFSQPALQTPRFRSSSSMSEGRLGRAINSFVKTKPAAVPPSPPTAQMTVFDCEQLKQLIEEMSYNKWCDPQAVDYWSTVKFPHESWLETTGLPEGLAVDLTCVRSGNFHCELNVASVTHTHTPRETALVDPHRHFPFYGTFFASTPHDNFCSMQGTTALIVSIESSSGREGFKKVVVWNKQGAVRLLIPATESVGYVARAMQLDLKQKFVKSPSHDLIAQLAQLEKRESVTAYKFGVIYVRPDQKDEDEIFGNVEVTPQFEEFLDFLGERVALQGWTKFRGGLDVSNNLTGSHSVYTTFMDFEVMFHVSTLLPNQPNDKQKIERKRHIGNDVVTIVFKEQSGPDDLFSPAIITSHFNHCFFVVSPASSTLSTTPTSAEAPAAASATAERRTFYRLSVVNKVGVSPYHPFLPVPGVFGKTSQFRDLLLLKMINAERTAVVESPEFRGLMTAHNATLVNLAKQYGGQP
eukprot:TRINITY_DN1257_c0_g1_i2.p1 TRINITY_DN1257_c0_g1~~TRINITY_DN1257_c0_g1_i2.p1  ORF type:complete len:856 (-),score=207.59 TRINITY_DN1257_c0_g1_i2:78-2291(-)